MNIRQLSLFLENRPGQLRVPCKVLGDAGIDILTMSLADTQQFGILRLVVKDWEKAKKVLEAFEKANLGVEYMYALDAGRERGKFATLIFRVGDPEKASRLLRDAGVRLLSPEELFARAGA